MEEDGNQLIKVGRFVYVFCVIKTKTLMNTVTGCFYIAAHKWKDIVYFVNRLVYVYSSIILSCCVGKT